VSHVRTSTKSLIKAVISNVQTCLCHALSLSVCVYEGAKCVSDLKRNWNSVENISNTNRVKDLTETIMRN
jgi:hypothetical protein